MFLRFNHPFSKLGNSRNFRESIATSHVKNKVLKIAQYALTPSMINLMDKLRKLK